MADVADTIDDLKLEVERLQRELAQANYDKIQSAQYGLDLLKEKSNWQEKCEEYENLYENTRHELHCVKEASNLMTPALNKFQTTHKVSTKTGIEQEESLLSETADREASLTSSIVELENELKQVRHELDRCLCEKEHLVQEANELQKIKGSSETEKKSLKQEVRELKSMETRMLADYSELEEENISLQKQVSVLRSSQVEFEGAKHELRRLQEEVNVLNGQMEEVSNLKRLALKQLDEALESLQAEREQKYVLRKELDQQISYNKLNYTRFKLADLSGEGGILDDVEGDEDAPVLKKIEQDFMKANTGTDGALSPNQTGVGDLYSELHMTEIKKLEQQVEKLETDKTILTNHLKEMQDLANRRQNDVMYEQLRCTQVLALLQSLAAFYKDLPKVRDEEIKKCQDNEVAETLVLKKLMDQHLHRFNLASKYIKDTQDELEKIQNTTSSSPRDGENMLSSLRDDMSRLKGKEAAYEIRIVDLQDDVKLLNNMSELSFSSLTASQDELVAISETIAQMYHHVCMVNGETPQHVMLDHVRQVRQLRKPAVGGEDADGSSMESSNEDSEKLDALRNKLSSNMTLESRSDPANYTKLVETVKDQVKHLRKAVDTTLEHLRQKAISTALSGASSPTANDISSGSEVEKEDLQEQILKLKSLLSTKREQIATLRTVLKANKQTAEVALANLKSKYENEKCVVSDTMHKLRHELKALKEDALTFASLRSMFAARCEEYVSQIGELQNKLAAAEEEKKTLNALLRMSIQQKLNLTQKLEDMEMDRERSSMRRSAGSSGPRTKGNFLPRVSHHHHAPPQPQTNVNMANPMTGYHLHDTRYGYSPTRRDY
uniref:Protein bicaudal D n=1 Tax=Strigamia maritima TaxID=126957 RepID=T1IM96_STRMM